MTSPSSQQPSVQSLSPDTFDTSAYAWLLECGRALTYYGTVDVAAQLHLLSCGVDVAVSSPVGVGVIESFSDTYSPPEEHLMISGDAICVCGSTAAVLSHPPLSVSEVIAAVAAHSCAEPPERIAVPSGVQLVVFTAGADVLRGTLVPDPENFDGPLLFAPLSVRDCEPLPLDCVASVFGAPEFVTV